MPAPSAPPNNVLRFATRAPVRPPTAPPPDYEARAHALDITASWIVEAPAGSGKTGLLVQRFLKLLADEQTTQPEEVLAITFTRKATTELRNRILSPLLAASASPDAPADLSPFDAITRDLAQQVLVRDAALGWDLLSQPHRLAVRTIDSLCAEIAASVPLLSGSTSARTLTDYPEPLYRLAAQRTLRQLGGHDAALHKALRTVLLHRDGNLGDCESLLMRMLAQREQWGELIPLGDELNDDVLEAVVRPRLERALEQIVCAGLTRAARALSQETLTALSWLAASLAGEPGYKEDSPIAICANKHESPEERAEHLEHWLALIGLLLKKDGDWRQRISRADVKFEITPDGKARLEEILTDLRHDDHIRDILCAVRCLPPARYPDNQWDVAKALFRLLFHALAELKVIFAERQESDFTETAIAAKQVLLSEDGFADLAASAGLTLRHLLVDEMQDTSSSQYELIQLLTRTWDGHSQTLFLVGDPKQSIYLFRQARVERFLRAMRDHVIGDIPLRPLYLTANFRSQASLVEDFNDNFAEIFPSSNSSDTPQAVDVPFVIADPTRPVSAFASGVVWHTCIEKEFTHEASDVDAKLHHREHEARSIRRIVETWLARPLPHGRTKPWQMAVLARNRDHLSAVVKEFRHPGESGDTIPFTAVEIERLGEQPEVLDLLALTRALHHPADRVAWLAVLHAPWCGLGLADLLALSGAGVASSHTQALPFVAPVRRDTLSDVGRQLLDRAWPILESALATRGRTSTSVWVERTWRSLGGDVTLTPRELANTTLFFTALRKLEEPGGLIDIAALSTAVKDLFVEPGSVTNAVTLSTIHKAKGLEWDVVIVPGLERLSRSSTSELLNWLELDSADAEAAHVILAPIRGRGEDPDPLYQYLNTVRCAREAAEHKRLFYVASTRASEELHLFAAATRSAKTQELGAPANSLLKAAWPAAQPHFLALETPDTTTTSATLSMFRSAVEFETEEPGTLALAASAAQTLDTHRPPLLHRLPITFDPHARFAVAEATRLPYTPAAALRQSPTFDRPEGSFAVRAFGNVVHRYLQLIADRMNAATTADALLAELSTWAPRLTASLRAEGLSPASLEALAKRALTALQQSLTDSAGRWILSPHTTSASEQTLASLSGELRVDRTFLAGAAPMSTADTHLWVIDFKTTEQGSRSAESFAEQERGKYGAQLQSYAAALATPALATPAQPIMLGLYYPLIPRLIHWPAAQEAGDLATGT